MVATTTQCVEGCKVTGYYGIVFGEVITGVNFLKGLGADIRNIVGGRSRGYEDELVSARSKALDELEKRAASMTHMPLLVLMLTIKYLVREICSWSLLLVRQLRWLRRMEPNARILL